MSETDPPKFHDQLINLELDFGDQGGIQRFSTVKEFLDWLDEERKFWSWLTQDQNVNSARNRQPQILQHFEQYDQQFRQSITSHQNQWTEWQKNYQSILKSSKDKDEKTKQEELQNAEKQKDKILTGLTKELGNVFQSHIRNSRNHVFRHEPEAQFITELAQEDPYSAAVALDYLLNAKSQDAKAYPQFSGKLLGALFRLNINRTVSPDIEAFKEASRTWSTELGSFREKYETLAADYEALKQSNQGTTQSWDDKTVEMQKAFDEQLQKQQQDLENLKETYESHMVLKGPMLYWRQKRKDHDRQIKAFQKRIIFWSIAGAIVLFASAYLLLPQFHPSDSIPWRQIGFFILASTFTLWFIRLLVKLLLSNIHLSADAREREVMIQTFMAMMRHKESREGVKKEDIALVLAPIFKPSTTGVIKDDGGPITLTDFISRMASK